MTWSYEANAAMNNIANISLDSTLKIVSISNNKLPKINGEMLFVETNELRPTCRIS